MKYSIQDIVRIAEGAVDWSFDLACRFTEHRPCSFCLRMSADGTHFFVTLTTKEGKVIEADITVDEKQEPLCAVVSMDRRIQKVDYTEEPISLWI